MKEKLKVKLSQAEVYGEGVLKEMRKNPGSCDLFERLLPKIGNNPLIVFEGRYGGSISLAQGYLRELSNIHSPHCSQRHLIPPIPSA